MLPILISVSVAPVSYFFCASAPLVDAANKAIAVEAIANRVAITRITFSPFPLPNDLADDVSGFLTESSFDLGLRYHLAENLTTVSPCGKSAGAASLVVNQLALTTNVAAQDVAEALPSLALELH